MKVRNGELAAQNILKKKGELIATVELQITKENMWGKGELKGHKRDFVLFCLV
jgi:hypothetical protein